ncbi:MAG: NADH-quinone oxidoreductase subunit M [Deltaproteobacteria bacterium]|nr:NADH-quinone oxidoreductase subunit M [Deltaproteobacteria bacterium]
MVNQSAGFLLPLLLLIPLIGAILIMLIPRHEKGLAHGVGIGFSLAAFFLSLSFIGLFKEGAVPDGYAMVFDMEWIEALGSHFKLGIDGISLWLVILTTFLQPIILLSATKATKKNVREFVALMLVLETGMLGAFLALDVFVFYIFWEIMLIPMYLLIGMWGGQRRLYASIKFVIFTMVGSLLMLVAIFYVYAKYGAITGEYTTDLDKLTTLVLPASAQVWCFLAFALAFAIKVPLFPLHTWLPDAHVEAPTAGSVVLAGVLLKFGIYGFIRFAMPLFPYGAAECAPYIAILAVAGIIYGAFVAFAQTDVKKLVAYSSVSHLGFCALGLFALTTAGIEGSIFGMLSHGLTTSGLFLAIGVVYERRHTRDMSEYGGLWKQMPVYAALFLICLLGSAGLPGLSGFIGEFLAIFGTFIAEGTFPEGYDLWAPAPILAAAAATGVIFGAIYLLYMFQKMMFGPLDKEKNGHLKDLSSREVLVFLPLVLMIFVMGIKPQPFLSRMEPAVKRFQVYFKAGLERELKPEAYVVGFVPKAADEADGKDEDPAGKAAPTPNPAAGGTPPAKPANPADPHAGHGH